MIETAAVAGSALKITCSRDELIRQLAIEHRQGEGVVEIVSGSAVYRIHTYNAEDFPRLPDPTGTTTVPIDAEALLETAVKVSRAASRDESRPVLTGILVRFEGENLVMAATDSYRLAVKETAMSAPGPELEAIIPARALQELVRIASGTEEIELGVHENHVIFSAGDVWLTSRRIDGQFPNYKQL